MFWFDFGFCFFLVRFGFNTRLTVVCLWILFRIGGLCLGFVVFLVFWRLVSGV